MEAAALPVIAVCALVAAAFHVFSLVRAVRPFSRRKCMARQVERIEENLAKQTMLLERLVDQTAPKRRRRR